MNDHATEYPVRVENTPLVDFLFPAPAERRPASIIAWWEKRRLPFNLVVGGSGLVTLGLAAISSALPPAPGGPASALFPILAYGALANICYTLGPATEIALHKVWGRRVLPAGPVLFRAGLVLSVGLTLVIPTILLVLGWLFRFLGTVF